MIDWRHGGWTGSIDRWVAREVRDQLRGSPAVRRARYGWTHRALRRLLVPGSIARFLAAYLVVDLLLVAAEALVAATVPGWLPSWSTQSAVPDIKPTILYVSSYFIGAQVGILGAVSIALALVTLIAQRENAATDVQIYYRESLAFEIVASCIALLMVLCAQLLWPLQFALHLTGLGTASLFFKLVLLGLHTGWLLLNLAAVGQFIATTFRFVQQPAREALRERYTANLIQPRDMTARLRVTLFSQGSRLLEDVATDMAEQDRPLVAFDFDFGPPMENEIETDFRHPAALRDVRMAWVRWVARRWSRRCIAATPTRTETARSLSDRGPVLSFNLRLDRRVTGRVAWCRRRGGVPLDWLEKEVLARAFIFRRTGDEG